MEQGKLASLKPQKRGRKGPDDQEAELSRLHQEIEQLQQRLQQAELIMDVQKNSCSCLD